MMSLLRSHSLFFVIILAAAQWAPAAGEPDLRILTFPIGLVTGELPIDVDLGASGAPAELFLDGTPVCSLSAAQPRCTVDVGAAPHVHLLELVRRDGLGRVTARASRWVNRPGQEAELAIRFEPRDAARGICSGRALWSHPLKQNPVLLEVTMDGRRLKIADDGRFFRFPCPNAENPHVIAGSAIFPDGRRAEAVALSGGFGGHAETGLTAVALVVEEGGALPCETITASLGDQVKQAGQTDFEIVFVLDPGAGFNTLYKSGWTAGAMNSTSSSTKQFDQMVRSGSKGSDARPKSSWKRSFATMVDAEKMWFVAPNENLQRVNGFGHGKINWLEFLFQYGTTKIEGTPRIADAVAASGLVAAAGPRRRAVVLVLGNKAHKDASIFSAQEARAYLAEVGVPLAVLRNGKERDDGWPKGVPARNMESMADALELLQHQVQNQCVTWFPGQMHPNQIASSLPGNVAIAGRRGEAPEEVETLWQQAAFDEPTSASAAYPGPQPAGRGEVEITAVTVLVKAVDGAGDPIPNLTAEELEITEDGARVAVLGLQKVAVAQATTTQFGSATTPPAMQDAAAPAVPALPVAIYVDRKLGGSTEITPSLRALAERSEWLVGLGPVDVVETGDTVKTVLEASRDPAAVRAALDGLADEASGQHAIEAIRTRFLRDMRKTPNRLPSGPTEEDESSVDGGIGGVVGALNRGEEVSQFERSKVLNAARSSIFEEDSVLRRATERMGDWALTSATERPRLLLAVGSGFDEDPVDFYLPFVEKVETHNVGSALEEFKRFRQSQRVAVVARDLAAAGWLVTPVATRSAGKLAVSADSGGGDRFQSFLNAETNAVRTRDSQWLLLDPLGSQKHLAAPSGGDVVMGGAGLDDLALEAAGWYRLSYQVDRAPDGALHELAIASARPGAELRTSEVVASETVEGMSAVRLRRLLRDSGGTGGLSVSLDIGETRADENDLVAGDVTVTVDFADNAVLFQGSARVFRISIGVRPGDQEPFIQHILETVDGSMPGWRYRLPMKWPKVDSELAIVVEDLGSGVWGGATVALP